ncbi:molecular chaperone [Psychromonas sp. SA13A]|uniref:TorD/DmsD family molecular chaperone n=1 Tax=Psychromonas sp. SA13A TaxID=2686346 RepID=UPI0014088F96|nr:molecular chaperone [Psychromonas sp. SA13A]
MIVDTAKLLGTLFYQHCSKTELITLVSALVDEDVLEKQTLEAAIAIDKTQLHNDFSILFEGLGDMPVPPWGSVYLDKERVLFGESTLTYRQFLQLNAISLNTGVREPEDQFGLMLLAFAYLIEQDKQQAAIELMEVHLLPWGLAYLQQLNKKSPNLFYKHMANDTQAWLQLLIAEKNMNVLPKKVHIYD